MSEGRPKLSWNTICGYGAGDAANNLAFTTTTMFLVVYYTDSVGLAAGAVGTLMLVVRLFDAFADVFAGQLVDKVNTRWGKFRPFILFCGIPLLAISFMVFHVPNFSDSGKLIYAYLTYAALGLAYSLVNIPYGSLAGAMSNNPVDRVRLSTSRAIAALLVGTTLGVVVSPMLSVGADLQHIFTTMMTVCLVLGTGLYLWTFFSSKETVKREHATTNFREGIRTVTKNKPLLMLSLSSILFLTATFVQQTLQIYYFRDAMNALSLVAVMALISLVATLVLAAVVPKVVRKVGKHPVYLAGTLFLAAGGLGLFFAPTDVPWIAVFFVTVGTIGNVMIQMEIWALEADTIEYGEWKTGDRAEGLSYALFSFSRKLGQAFGGAIGGWVLAGGAYVAGTELTPQLLTWLRLGMGIIPMTLALIVFFIMLRYPLTDKAHAELVDKIAKRMDEAEDGQAENADAVS